MPTRAPRVRRTNARSARRPSSAPVPSRRAARDATLSAHRRSDPDQLLQRVVQRWLGTVTAVRPATIGVAVDTGVVTLSGAVPSDAVRRRLVRAALQVPGVAVVGDDLRDAGATDAEARPCTADLADRVGRAVGHPFRDWVVVRVDDGAAVVRGRFHSLRDRRRALLAVWSFRGVRRVDDRTRMRA